MKHILFLGVLVGIGMLATSFVASFALNILFPSTVQEYQNPALFRPWSDPLMLLYFVHPFMLGIALAFVYERVKTVLPGKTPLLRGMKFGFIVWLVATLPGMLISYSSFSLSFAMVLTWTLSALFQLIVAGVVLTRFGREKV